MKTIFESNHDRYIYEPCDDFSLQQVSIASDFGVVIPFHVHQ